jgi:hypothetical protein
MRAGRYLSFPNLLLGDQPLYCFGFRVGREKLCPSIYCRQFTELRYLANRGYESGFKPATEHLGYKLAALKSFSFGHAAFKKAAVDQYEGRGPPCPPLS